MARIVFGAVLLIIGLGGLLDVWLNPTVFTPPLSGHVAAFSIVFVLPGLALVCFGRRARRRRARLATATATGAAPSTGPTPAIVREPMAAPPHTQATSDTESPDTRYALVLVLGVPQGDFPLGQYEAELVRRIAASPSHPLLPDATITTLRGMNLPVFTRSALEPFVWSLQARYERRGGAWQAEYSEFPLARFLVLYLE